MKVVHTSERKEATPKLKAAASLSGYAVNNRLNHLTSTKLIRKDVKRNILSNTENKWEGLRKLFFYSFISENKTRSIMELSFYFPRN